MNLQSLAETSLYFPSNLLRSLCTARMDHKLYCIPVCWSGRHRYLVITRKCLKWHLFVEDDWLCDDSFLMVLISRWMAQAPIQAMLLSSYPFGGTGRLFELWTASLEATIDVILPDLAMCLACDSCTVPQYRLGAGSPNWWVKIDFDNVFKFLKCRLESTRCFLIITFLSSLKLLGVCRAFLLVLKTHNEAFIVFVKIGIVRTTLWVEHMFRNTVCFLVKPSVLAVERREILGSMILIGTIVKPQVVLDIQNSQNAKISFVLYIFSAFWTSESINIPQNGRLISTDLRSMDINPKHLTLCSTVLHTVQKVDVQISFLFPVVHVVICPFLFESLI